jgi:nitroimidazol reductase NimA-like FMN-containing flavoprotein (pyridoxamine 5'-phosphate oxidase superfamily)
MMQTLGDGLDVCVTVTILDGLVLARSAFNHSMNYRSVVVLGRAHTVDDHEEKLEALRRFSEHVLPGRWADARQPSENELKATVVLSLPLDEASAKVRSGPPIDAKEDYSLGVWAGVIPLRIEAGAPVADPQFTGGSAAPDYAANYTRDDAGAKR